MTKIEENKLIESGLSLEQAKIYLYLLENGVSSAKPISVRTGIGRALSYKVLDQLLLLGLVEKREDVGKIAFYQPKHPDRLKEMIKEKQHNLEKAFSSLNSVFGSLASDFNMLSGKPNVHYYEGVDGLKKVYDDILDVGENIRVISSPINKEKPFLDIIRQQIERQVKHNIKTKAITPLSDGQEVATPIEEDAKFLITRKSILAKKLDIPAQIIIYGDKVAITNFKEAVITVLIESKYITETFGAIFEFIWANENRPVSGETERLMNFEEGVV